MRRYNYFLIGAVLLLLIGCGSKEREPIVKTGTANQPVNLEVQAEDAQAESTVEWSFDELPENISLSQYDFQPINTSPQVSFIPPDSGAYRISYSVTDQSGEVVAVQPFVVQVAPKERKPVTEEGEDITAAEMEKDKEEEPAMAEEAKPEPPSKPKTEPKPTQRKTTKTTTGTDRADLIPRVPGRYTVQVSSWKTFSKAESVANSVKKLGYDAYIQRAKFPDTGKVWYRVRVGSFTTYEAAKTLRNKLIDEPSLPNSSIWVDFQRKDT